MNKDNQEVINKWGKTNAYNEYLKKTENYSSDKFVTLSNLLQEIFKEFSILLQKKFCFKSDEAQGLVKKLQSFITDNYYNCTNEILLYLGQIYISDIRFKNNIDHYCDGTALYIKKAIDYYCN